MKKRLLPIVILSLLFGGGLGYRLGNPSLGFPSYSFSDFNPDEFAYAVGSWVSDSPEGYFHDHPFQTSEISCYRFQALCIESRALLNRGTNNIFALTLQYQVKTWQPEKVVAVLDGSAVTIEITFDRNNKVVTVVETQKAAGTVPVYAHLGDGRWAVRWATYDFFLSDGSLQGKTPLPQH
jgi:hypothetical protein